MHIICDNIHYHYFPIFLKHWTIYKDIFNPTPQHFKFQCYFCHSFWLNYGVVSQLQHLLQSPFYNVFQLPINLNSFFILPYYVEQKFQVIGCSRFSSFFTCFSSIWNIIVNLSSKNNIKLDNQPMQQSPMHL